MTSPNTCPLWCTGSPDDPSHEEGHHWHFSRHLRLGSRRPQANAPYVSAGVWLSATAPEPVVSVHSAAGWVDGEMSIVSLAPREAGPLARLVELLADATPGQHREVAEAIRQAAGLISGEAAS